MKKVMFFLVIVLGMTTMSHAQTKSDMKKDQAMAMSLNNGVKMVDGKAMVCKNGKCHALTTTYTCSDGCRISTDGTVTRPDGSTMKLMNGYQVDKSGKVAMIPHGQKGHVCTKECPMYGKM